MKKVMVIGCGKYMEQGYGCPAEWRCLKAAGLGEGEFDEPSQVVGFLKCECPGRPLIPNIGMFIKQSENKPDVIHFSSCLINAFPGCPYWKPEEVARLIEDRLGIPVISGTHHYHA